MQRDSYTYTKSSFLNIAKDTSIIIDRIIKNQKILKLLYHTTSDSLKKPDLTSEQIKSLFKEKQISNIPTLKINAEGNKYNYIRVSYTDFYPNDYNPYYRDNVIEIKIICPFDCWDLGNFELRPYRIAGEIDALLQNTHLTGIGTLQLAQASQDIYDEVYGGITLTYLTIHGNDDKVNPLE